MTNILFKNIKWKMSKNERDFLYRKVAAALLFFPYKKPNLLFLKNIDNKHI